MKQRVNDCEWRETKCCKEHNLADGEIAYRKEGGKEYRESSSISGNSWYANEKCIRHQLNKFIMAVEHAIQIMELEGLMVWDLVGCFMGGNH